MHNAMYNQKRTQAHKYIQKYVFRLSFFSFFDPTFNFKYLDIHCSECNYTRSIQREYYHKSIGEYGCYCIWIESFIWIS